MADPNDQIHGSFRVNDLAASYRLPLSSAPTANQAVQFWKTGAVFTPNCIIEMTSTGAQPATANSQAVIGVNREPRTFQANPSTGTYGIAMPVGYGRVSVIADVPMPQGAAIKAANLGNAGPFITPAGTTPGTAIAGATIGTSSAGGNFANQPLNDSVQVLSSNAGDTTQVVTLYGTTTATNTVVKQTVALNGTTAVASAKVDWGQILGVTLSASCAGTVTIRKTTGPATIITLTTGQLSKGLVTVTAPGLAYNGIPAVVAGGASTKQFGVIGTDATGALQLDSVALNGTTSVPLNSSFQTIQFLLVGDNATATTTTLSVGPADAGNAYIGRLLEPATVALQLVDAFVLL